MMTDQTPFELDLDLSSKLGLLMDQSPFSSTRRLLIAVSFPEWMLGAALCTALAQRAVAAFSCA